ncbi:MAG: hypothetical protein R2856_37225 [Caldilineaceae bacterium]
MSQATSSKQGGISELARKEERLALLLLIPTLFILFAIALYPLGQVFFTSLTNETFASATETEFIGLQNYRQLLSMTIRELPVRTDENTGQALTDPDTGEPQYELAVRILPRERFGTENSISFRS